MRKEDVMCSKKETPGKKSDHESIEQPIHPSWVRFIKVCEKMRFGELTRVCIQDGLPVLAEEVRKKVKF